MVRRRLPDDRPPPAADRRRDRRLRRGVGAGDRVLDVAVGDGNAAIECVRRGASVVGIDLTPAQIDRARARCAAEGVEVDLRVGDAMALELDEESFDVVLSVLGVMFAPDPAVAVAELTRAVRPGGVVANASWEAGDGWTSAWRGRVGDVVPGAIGPSPTERWGDAEMIAERLAAAGLVGEVTSRHFAWRFPSVDHAIEELSSSSPPHVTALAKAAEVGRRDELEAAFREIVTDRERGHRRHLLPLCALAPGGRHEAMMRWLGPRTG